MGKRSIENKIKDRLIRHESYIDKENLMESLGLNQKKKRKFGVWFFMIGLIGFGGLIFMVSNIFNNSKSDEATREFNTSQITDKSEISAQELVELDKNINYEKQKDLPSNLIKNEAKKLEPITKKVEIINIDSSIITGKTRNKESTSVKELNFSNSSFEIVQNQKEQQSSNLIGIINSDINFESKAIIKVNEEIKIAEQQATSADVDISKDLELESENANLERKPNSDIINNHVASDLESNKKSNFKTIFGNDSIASSIQEYTDNNSQELKNETIKLTPIDKTSQWSLYAHFLYGDFNQKFQARSEEFIDFAEIRSRSETELEFLSTDLLLKYTSKYGVYMASGIEFSQYNFKMNYIELYEDSTTQNIITDVLINYKGERIEKSKLVSFDQKIARTWTIYNHLNQLNIPFKIGYEKKIKKSRIFGDIGFHYTAAQWFVGKILDYRNSVIVNPNIYKTSNVISYSANMGYGYQVKEKISLNFGLQYRLSPKSVTLNDYNVLESYQIFGIQTGVEYHF